MGGGSGSHGAMFHLKPARWASLLCVMALPVGSMLAEQYLVYVGTYTGAKSKGIHAFRTDTATGVIEELGLVAETANPTFLAVHPDGRHLYAANEVGQFDGKPGGGVTAFEIDLRSGALKETSRASAVGGGPCHLVVDRTGRQVLMANYGGGSVVSLPLDGAGRVGAHSAFIQHRGSSVNPARQKEPHAHSINVSPDNRFAFAADLGTDRVYVYPLDPARGLGSTALASSPALAPGSGPRHFAFHPGGRFAYVINEMLSTVTAFRYEGSKGTLTAVQTIGTLPEGWQGSSSTAEVVVHPNGRFLYGSNRGHDSLAIYAIDGATGRLTLVGHESTGGKTPRNFNLDPTGTTLWAANQSTDNIVIFSVDGATGRLKRTGQELKMGSPVCVKFVRVP
jgi:6-phosphogluconolactonase